MVVIKCGVLILTPDGDGKFILGAIISGARVGTPTHF